jgi:hypothetical protein
MFAEEFESFLTDDELFVAFPFLEDELLDPSPSSQSLQIEDEESTVALSSGPLLEADEESSQPQRPIPPNTAKKSNVLNLFIF